MVYEAVIKSAPAGEIIGDLGSSQITFIRIDTWSHWLEEDFIIVCPPLKRI